MSPPTCFDDIEKDVPAYMEAVPPNAFTATNPTRSDSNAPLGDIPVITQDDALPKLMAPDLSPDAADLLHDTLGSLRNSDSNTCAIDEVIDQRFDKGLLQLATWGSLLRCEEIRTWTFRQIHLG